MDDAGMISAITTSIQTEANLITLLNAMVTNSLSQMTTTQLQTLCTTLGIDYTQPDPGD